MPPSGALVAGHVGMVCSVKGVSMTLITFEKNGIVVLVCDAAALFDPCHWCDHYPTDLPAETKHRSSTYHQGMFAEQVRPLWLRREVTHRDLCSAPLLQLTDTRKVRPTKGGYTLVHAVRVRPQLNPDELSAP